MHIPPTTVRTATVVICTLLTVATTAAPALATTSRHARAAHAYLATAWNVSANTTSGRTTATTVTPAEGSWTCDGSAHTPHTAIDGQQRVYIGYDADQTCTGDYGTQRVCIALQQRDYFGDFEDVTTQWCSAWTVNSKAYAGRSVLCSALGHGTYRTRAHGQNDYWTSQNRYSADATLC